MIRLYRKELSPNLVLMLLRNFKSEAFAYLREKGFKVPLPSHSPSLYIIDAHRLYLNGRPYAGAIPEPGEEWRDEHGWRLQLVPNAINIARQPFEEMLETTLHEVLHLVPPRPYGFADEAFKAATMEHIEAHIKLALPGLIAAVTPGALLRHMSEHLARILDFYAREKFNTAMAVERHSGAFFELYEAYRFLKYKFPEVMALLCVQPRDDVSIKRKIVQSAAHHFRLIALRVENAIKRAEAEDAYDREILMKDPELDKILRAAYEIRLIKRSTIKMLRNEPYGEY